VNWPKRVTARSLLGIAFCRPSRRLGRAQCPVLMVVPDTDHAVLTDAAVRAANFPQVTVVRSRGGHYDVYSRGRDYEHELAKTRIARVTQCVCLPGLLSAGFSGSAQGWRPLGRAAHRIADALRPCGHPVKVEDVFRIVGDQRGDRGEVLAIWDGGMRRPPPTHPTCVGTAKSEAA
jgi:hypothetical protein